MNVLAIVPARGGSKGVPNKNIRRLAGKPLLAWSIEAALAAELVDRVVVSTDSPRIAEVAFVAGAEIVMRPAELATDQALTDPVLVHAIDRLREASGPTVYTRHLAHYRPDLVVLLQPTVPFRREGLIDDCIRRLLATGADSLLTGIPLHFVWWRESANPDRAADGEARWRSQCPRRPRRQDMVARELMYHEDGSVYVTRTELLENAGRRLGGRVELFENEPSVDIDTERDFLVAEALFAAKAADLHSSALASRLPAPAPAGAPA